MHRITVFCLLLWSAPVLAGPFVVSSPDSTSAKKIKVSGDLKDGPTKNSLTLPKVELATAITSRLDFAVEVPYKTIEQDHADTESGIGDMDIKSKWNFYRSGPLALAMEPELSLPTGDADRGLGNDDAGIKLPLILGYSTQAWDFGSELGYQHVFHQHEDSGYWGFLALRSLTPTLKMGAEIVAESSDAKLRQIDTLANIGLKWKLPERFELQALVGRTLHSEDGDITRQYKLALEKKF